jgi:hypothetical protein
MAIEIVDLPIENSDFFIVMLVYQRVNQKSYIDIIGEYLGGMWWYF